MHTLRVGVQKENTMSVTNLFEVHVERLYFIHIGILEIEHYRLVHSMSNVERVTMQTDLRRSSYNLADESCTNTVNVSSNLIVRPTVEFCAIQGG